MNKDYIAHIIILVVGIVVFGILFLLNSDFYAKTDTADGVTNNLKPISSGSTDEGDVSIVLTPLSVANGIIQVEVAANTHSVDLSQFDLKKVITLEYQGKTFKPTSAFSLSGHHSSGMITFDVGSDVDGFTIKINGIPSAEERVFEW